MDRESSVHIKIIDGDDAGPVSADAALRRNARDAGSRIAFRDPPDRSSLGLGREREITWSQADAIADVLAERFGECGLKARDVIAIQMPNIVEAPLLLLGAWRAGLVPCTMPLFWQLEEVRQAFSQIKPVAAVSVGHYGDRATAETLGEAAARQMSIRYVLALGEDLPDGVTPIDEWLADAPSHDGKESGGAKATAPSDETAILTWRVSEQGPHPVPRTHNELTALARLFTESLKLNSGDSILNTYPYISIEAVAGQLIAPLIAGASTTLHLPFDFEIFVRQLKDHRITCTAVPAPVITALEERHNLCSDDLHLSRIGCIWQGPHSVKSGSELFDAPLPIFDIHNFGELALMVRERTQGSDPALLPLGKINAAEDDSADEPELETRVRGSVRSEDSGQILKGTLFVRGTSVPSGPFDAAGEQARAELKPDAQGFLDTGIGCVVGETLEGHFRCKKSEDLIYHGGAVIAASELDDLYAEFDDFLDAAAFVLNDAVIGERIFAAVVPRPERSPSLKRLKHYLSKKRVAAYKAPDQLVIVKSIPREADGTVLRDQILGQI
ncbi:MAG: AMP-binding protein [Alphaproteobacteria bacterium]